MTLLKHVNSTVGLWQGFTVGMCLWEEVGRKELMTGRIKAMGIVSYKLVGVKQLIILTPAKAKFCFSS